MSPELKGLTTSDERKMVDRSDIFDPEWPHGWLTDSGEIVVSISRLNNKHTPIYGVVKLHDGQEVVRTWNNNGTNVNRSDGNLLNAPNPLQEIDTCEFWIILCQNTGGTVHRDGYTRRCRAQEPSLEELEECKKRGWPVIHVPAQAGLLPGYINGVQEYL